MEKGGGGKGVGLANLFFGNTLKKKNKILIAGNHWDVDIVPATSKYLTTEAAELPDGLCWDGGTYPETKKIVVSNRLPGKSNIKVLLHEILHAITCEYVSHPILGEFTRDSRVSEVGIDILSSEIISTFRQLGLIR